MPPSGARARAAANLQALRVLDELEREQRPASAAERDVLARWSSWGAVPEIFDETRAEWAPERAQLRELLGDEQRYAQARRTTINAHYTHPAIARAMWDLARELGFQCGRVLEPGCGAGVFIGLASVGADTTGVELDDTTAAIAQQLHPDARIISRSFADYRPRGTFDLVIGNVPFADVRLHDPIHNRQRHSIHNHFIVKSLALTRPGGLVIVLSSRYTLDAGNPAARREMSDLADLLGAIRLPTGAHRRAAGTDALTDLLVFRRRPAGTEPLSEDWINTRTVKVNGGEARINEHFAADPDRVLGELEIGHGMYGADTLTVAGERDPEAIAEQLAARAWEIVAGAPAIAASDATVDVDVDLEPRAVIEAPEGLWDGHLLAQADGTFAQVKDGIEEPIATPRTIGAELRALLGLRDGARAVLTAEAHSLQDTPHLEQLRGRLREDYTAYYARHGPINRFQLQRTGRTDAETGEEIMRRVAPPAIRALRGDPFAPLVMSLEVFDDESQTATPAALLSKRMIAPRTPVLGVDSAQDALAVCLDTLGRVDLEEIARLLGRETDDARAELGELVYTDPENPRRLIAAAEYLSGNVRVKLEHARTAAAGDTSLEVNVTALTRALPADIGADEIQPRLGAAWITTEDHRAFLAEILEDPSVQVEHPGAMVWAVKARKDSLLARSEWGTSRMAAGEIAKAVLEQRPVQVTDELDDGRRVVNPVETAAAQDKAHALQERFADWVWENPDRARRLLGEYNRRFNSLVLRNYSGERLSLPGLARTFQPHAHQRAAVARIIAEPAVGLFHQVGAGKTAEMIIGAAELRRLGLVRKPAVVVPNHMLDQFTREALQIYPQARILAASSQDLAGEKRRQFVARAASNDWDAIILTRSAFERIPVTPETQRAYEERQIADLRTMLANAQTAGGRLTVKRVEKLLLRAEERLAAKLDTDTDRGIFFEETGIDYLGVDEAHSYKNLLTVSNIPGAAIEGSKRATDLDLKLQYLRERYGGHVATLATATPIANSITEAHVMQRYLRPDLLADAGVEHFDAWAATFGQTVTEIEMAPTGGGNYRMNSRFSRFNNVPEMLRIWGVFADVKTADELQLAVPELAGDETGERRPRTVVIPAGPEITDYLQVLAERADRVRSKAVAPEEDNMLKITGDGRKAALDMRLVVGERTAGDCKLDIAAGNIARLWQHTKHLTYTDPDSGRPSSTPGALQIVFCDLSTPREGWNAYDELRGLLVEHGIPRDRIRFIHEARNDAEKGRLFAACRNGHVSVLVGSTEKMGVGTNIQTRAIALHSLDCPWRPADTEQREGRILRQGNQNKQVGIYRYVVERSFDAYSWQTVERKAKFISQVTRGRLDVRSIDDIGDNALSYTEVKALASGDPLILEQASAANELTKLQRQRRAWERNRQLLRDTAASATARQQARAADIEQVDAALKTRTDTRGEKFAMTIGATIYTERRSAAVALTRWAQTAALSQARLLGELGGLKLTGVIRLDYAHDGREAHVTLDGVPVEPAHATLEHLHENPLGLVRQLEHRVQDLDGLRGRLVARQQQATQEGTQGREALAKPFKHADELVAAERKLKQIEARMKHAGDPRPAPDDTSRGPGTPVPSSGRAWTPAPPPPRPFRPAAPLAPGHRPSPPLPRPSGPSGPRLRP